VIADISAEIISPPIGLANLSVLQKKSANSLVEVYICLNFTTFVDSKAMNQGNTSVQQSSAVFFA
jgi:hypothetical protein